MRLLLVLAIAGGCTGTIEDPGSTPIVSTDPCEIGQAPGWVGVRRLSRREYVNTLRDLLGVEDPTFLDALPNDPLKGGYDNNASLLTTTPELLERYVDVADRAIAAAEPSRLLACTPAANSFSDPCIEGAVRDFARRAYRRPLDADDVNELGELYAEAAAASPDAASTMAWVALGILTSSKVLYQMPGPVGADRALDGFALAQRLSYFLWSSTPDDRLLDLAESGMLQEPGILEGEIRRMLADERAGELTREFTTHWLDLGSLPQKTFDASRYPEADSALLASFQGETVAFAHHVFTNDLDPNELLSANYTFVDERLAAHYMLDAAPGGGFVRADLPSERRGLLTQGAILASTSHPDRTSIPARGMWVMDNLFCLEPPPPPPASVDTGAFDRDTSMLTQRERFEVHRASAACSVCHAVMDELGFGLENYDPLGRYRTEDNGGTIDSRGELPDGRTFSGAVELSELVVDDGDTFERCVAQNLLAYAVGRLLTERDDCALDAILESSEHTTVDLLVRIAQSSTFTREAVGPEVSP